MPQIEKTVFISYRRTNSYHALAIFKHLHERGYDVFIDYEGINSGAFDQIILNQIKARAHFIVILTPSALERCTSPDDWLRLEIETAIDNKRNIIPLMFDGFNWGNMRQFLVGKMTVLDTYNALDIPSNYFDAAMERLRERFLNIAIDAVIHPTPKAETSVVEQKVEQGVNQPAVTEQQLSAGEYFERGNRYNSAGLYDDAIGNYNEAIHYNSHDAHIFNNRGDAYAKKGDYDRAIDDFNYALQLNPKNSQAYSYRGNSYLKKLEYDRAIADFTEALHLNLDDLEAYLGRGNAYIRKGDADRAISDFYKALSIALRSKGAYFSAIMDNAHLGMGWAFIQQQSDYEAIENFRVVLSRNPNNSDANFGMGIAYLRSGTHRTIFDAIKCFDTALKFNPNFNEVYYQRGLAYLKIGNYANAIKDFTRVTEFLISAPNLAEVYCQRGLAYIALARGAKNVVQGVADYDRAIANYDRAIADFDKALSLDSRFIQAQQTRANALKEKSHLQTLHKKDKKQGRKWFGRG
jgi:tetratricopeptide (TPR) repeat protein